MKIKVKYFGIPMANLGPEANCLELPANASVEQLLHIIRDQLEGQDKELLEAATFMVNRTRAEKYTVLKDGDEVVIMYSLAGG
ncbi:MAG TPA: MoaD/ThiS family protein [Firmicutes bacterium]|nr:MoaD/ThiS family protein [Bacillota bacterium]